MNNFKGDLGKIDELLSQYKFNKAKLKNLNIDLDYLNEFEPRDVDHIQECKYNISLLENKIDNIECCLNELNDDEYKFIEEVYYNYKKYKDVIPLIKNSKGDNINPVVSLPAINKYGSEYKKSILNKLFKFNILNM